MPMNLPDGTLELGRRRVLGRRVAWGCYGLTLGWLLNDLKTFNLESILAGLLTACYTAAPAWLLGRRLAFIGSLQGAPLQKPGLLHPENPTICDNDPPMQWWVAASLVFFALCPPFCMLTFGAVALVLAPVMAWCSWADPHAATTFCGLLWVGMLLLWLSRIKELHWWELDLASRTLVKHRLVSDLQTSQRVASPIVAVGAAPFPKHGPMWRVFVYLADGTSQAVERQTFEAPARELAKKLARQMLLPFTCSPPETVCRWTHTGEMADHLDEWRTADVEAADVENRLDVA